MTKPIEDLQPSEIVEWATQALFSLAYAARGLDERIVFVRIASIVAMVAYPNDAEWADDIVKSLVTEKFLRPTERTK